MTQLSISSLNGEIRDIAEKLDGIFSDPDSISATIECDPKLRLSDATSGKEKSTDVQALLAQDTLLSDQLVVCRELGLVSDLLEEAKMNLQLCELENCFYSLQNIRKKATTIDFQRLPVRFEQDLKLHLDEMHAHLVTRCDDVMHHFWKVDDCHITFVPSTAIGTDKVEYQYSYFSQFLKTCFFPNGRFEPTNWFISSLSMTDTKEAITRQLSALFTQYIELEVVQERLKGILFSDSVFLVYKNGSTLEVTTKKCSLDDTMGKYSVVVQFLLRTLTSDDREIILSRLGNTLAVEVLKFFKQNSTLLLSPGSEQKEQLSRLNDDLKHLSSSTKGDWSYNGTELDSMLNDDSVINNVKLDKLLQSEIVRIRETFSTSSWSKTSVVKVPVQGSAQVKREEPAKVTDDSSEDEWNWGNEVDFPETHDDEENDGWGDEIELSVDDNNEPLDSSIPKVPKNSVEKDDWQSSWGETEITDEEDTGERKITQLPALCLQILSDFETGCDEIGREKIEMIVDYKRNLLLTSFMAMCVCKCKDWWQLHHDIEYILTKCPNQRVIFRLKELDAHFVQTHVDNLKKTVQTLIQQQFRNFQANEKAPNWGITIESLLPYLETVALPTVFKLHDPRVLSDFVEYVYADCFVAQLMSWRMISEKNSENLEEMIKLLLASTKHPSLQEDQRCKQSREKLAVIGDVLTAHLTDIMDMFSNGDFYLFSTDEIVQWIVLLFADTGLRRECLDEIRTIRQEQQEDR
ncbi:LAFA_0G02652g1_1 [Lachancea sp. 'fantastica']|nr:LAFA_0G02652g1_1 [Lachancea sp. 'fantastica']